MNQVRQILLRQREEFSAKLAPTRETCANLQANLNEQLEIARVLQVSIAQIDAAIAAIDADEARRANPVRPKIMEIVLDILEHAPNGMTAREIMTEINTRNLLGESILRQSLSPQLSRLKDRDRKIDLRGDRWVRLPDEPSLFTPKE
jgi:predicted transcriptional regulator